MKIARLETFTETSKSKDTNSVCRLVCEEFTLNKDTIIIIAPIFTKPHFLQGFLEGTLNLKLTTLESNQTRTIYTIDKT